MINPAVRESSQESPMERSISIVRKRDATLTGRTGHYAHGLEGHVGHINLREGEAEVVYMGGYADGAGGVGGVQTRNKLYYALARQGLNLLRSQPMHTR